MSLILITSNAFADLLCHSLYSKPMTPTLTRVEEWDDVKVLVKKENLFGKEIEVRQVSRDQLLRGETLLGESLGGDEAVFIGLNSLGHMYLVANIYRFDGKFAFEKPQYNSKSSHLNKGIVLRIQDTDGTLQDQIIHYYKTQGPPRAINCSSGICHVFSQATKIKLAENIKQKILPKELIKKIITDGIHNQDGSSREVQVFLLGNSKPDHIFKAADRYAAQMANTATSGLLPTFFYSFLK